MTAQKVENLLDIHSGVVNRRAMWPPYECEHCKRVSGVVQSNGILKLCRSLSIVEYLLLYVYFVVSNSHSSHSALFIVGMRVVAWMSPNIDRNEIPIEGKSTRGHAILPKDERKTKSEE